MNLRDTTTAELLLRLNDQIAFLRQDHDDGFALHPKEIESLQQTHDFLVSNHEIQTKGKL